ncbi:phosphodiester glycosidase family protein [Coleofasciculus sp. FACHB-1120]|uniref:phosphodiester glycosidase family protein n=1 Tax=Coleofasciculus sp. FACHB-1120 TaxID=2692783 RepID=UPI0016897CB8|nr:phosphodiester glycosidase family protein [Coleofasciculus sp. FACHB-1120]MBD2742388.1 phosphodiester glycosidase family protein [Coleofasciculus sp. FACHB-1120]
MFTKTKFLSILLVTFIAVFSIHIYLKNNLTIPQVQVKKIVNIENTVKSLCDCQSQECQFSIEFIRTDHQGNAKVKGANYVLIFDPKSPKLDFKVSLALAHEIYAKDAKGRFRKEYIPKQFHEIIADENAKLNGKRPIAAINADYIDPENKPQGLNISRGIEYSGLFKDKRSSFGISGGTEERKATIQIGKRNEKILNYNLVGGNGRFYKDGIFKDICNDLGEYACKHETSRSMAAITSKGYVIFLVNNVETDGPLYPDKFDDVLEGISKNNCLGGIQEAMLFDGGFSTAFYYNNKIYVENFNPIGSVFLIYKTE